MFFESRPAAAVVDPVAFAFDFDRHHVDFVPDAVVSDAALHDFFWKNAFSYSHT